MAGDLRGREEWGKEGLTHMDAKGRARMVDVSAKKVTERVAVAQARIAMKRKTLNLILNTAIEKGDVLAVAQVAGIMAAKKAGELIPMCHPIAITSLSMDYEIDEENSSITALVTAKTRDRTGIEMEALTGAAVAALTIYDMCKAVDRSMTICDVQLVSKTGGKSGTYTRRDKGVKG
jgi:cyclic pyranopterin phosphate synthase